MSAWLGIGRDEVELLHRFQVAMTDRPGCYVLGALVENNGFQRIVPLNNPNPYHPIDYD
jgi:hypothetical protein